MIGVLFLNHISLAMILTAKRSAQPEGSQFRFVLAQISRMSGGAASSVQAELALLSFVSMLGSSSVKVLPVM